MTFNLNAPRYAFGSTMCENGLIVAGGFRNIDDSSAKMNSIEMFDVTTAESEQLPSMVFERSSFYVFILHEIDVTSALPGCTIL